MGPPSLGQDNIPASLPNGRTKNELSFPSRDMEADAG